MHFYAQMFVFKLPVNHSPQRGYFSLCGADLAVA